MWASILEAYNNTLKMSFRVMDWFQGRPIARLKDKRALLEIESRAAQIKGDVNALRRVRAQIEEVDRNLESLRPKF